MVDMETIFMELKEIRQDIADLRRDVTYYKSFVRGILWTFSAVAAVASFVFGVVLNGGGKL